MSKHYMASKRKKINKSKVFFTLVFIAIVIWLIYFVTSHVSAPNSLGNGSDVNTTQENIIPEDKVATIVSIGDTLVHSQVYKDAYDSSTGEYDFSPLFKDVSHYFTGRTLGICNLETSLAGADRGYSGYPTFNTPDHLATDLKELGIDVATTANNHALDMGYSGLTHALGVLDSVGIEHTGSARNTDEQNKILFKDLNGIKTAFLAFTYGTNGIPVPTGKEYCVNLIDKDFMKKKLDQAKSEGAELICVSMHWGVEYQTKANSEQKDLAEFLIKNGADIILGCHPHVLEQMEMESFTLSDGTTRSGYVIYSMGNFFSAQTFPNTRDTLILNIQIRKNGATNKVSIDSVKYAPVYDYDNGTSATDRYELLDLDAIIEDRDSGTNKWSSAMHSLAETEITRIKNIVGPEIDNTKVTVNTEGATNEVNTIN